MACLFLSLLVTATLVQAAPKLESYNVDTSKVSVSGISAGGAMAMQYHVVHSRDIMGIGMVAGLPFVCSDGRQHTSLLCMTKPSSINVFLLRAITDSGVRSGYVDATSNMWKDMVYIFDGTEDSIVEPAVGQKVAEYYKYYTSGYSIKTEFSIHAEHGMPTMNYGGQCDKINTSTYLNNCGYSAAFNILVHIYGGLQEPTYSTEASGQLLQFDQSEFFHLSTPATYSMDTTGYIYVPTGCTGTNKCKLHVAFHGCQMGRDKIGDEYVRHGGYNEAGEVNNIIILYPQVISMENNMQGCWDWFGFTGAFFATNDGFQMKAVEKMISRVTGSDSTVVG